MPIKMQCEEILPWFGLQAEFDLWEQRPDNPVTIIRTGETWGAVVRWTTRGELNNIMCGRWVIQGFLEQYGPQEAPALAPVNVTIVSAPNNYSVTLTFPPQEEGAYRLAITIRMLGPRNVPAPIACSGETSLLQFYPGGPIQP